MPPALKRLLSAFLRICLAVAIVFPIISAWSHIHRHHKPVEGDPRQYVPPLDFTDVTFRAADGMQLSGWLIPAKEPKGGIVVCHGVGANREDVLCKAQFLVKGGYTCFLFDFRDHGKSA